MTPELSHEFPNHPRLARTLEGTTGPVYSLGWSPDGRMLATAGYAQVKLWHAATLQEITTLRGHTDFVWGVAWSPDGTALATCGQEGSVRLWNTADGQCSADLDAGAWAFCVSWSPDGRRLVVGTAAYTDETNIETFSGKCQIWDVETRRKVRELDVPSFIISTAWFPDGKALVIGRWDGRLSLWDGESSAPWKTMAASAERSDVNGLAWSPDRTVLASAQQDGMVRIWDPAGEVLKTFAGHTAGIRGLAWSPDGNRLASTGLDAAIWVWRVQDGQALAHLTPNALPMWALSWSPDGKWLAAGTGEYGRDIPGGSVLIYQMPQA